MSNNRFTERLSLRFNTHQLRSDVVTLGRFELPTCGLGNRRSIHLSYRARF